MADAVLKLEGLTKNFGGLRVTDGVTLTVAARELHAVIGPNGAGKTTLIEQICGTVAADAGRIVLCGEDVTRLPVARRAQRGLARSFQITSILPGFAVVDNVALAVQARSGSSFRFFGDAGAEAGLNAQALAVLAEVGLADRAALPAGQLSHGDKRALELAMALAMRPRLLVLDEPMAGSGRDDGARLVAVLRRLKGTLAMLLVEHDMEAVFALADRVSVLIHGRIVATGTPAQVRANPEVVAAYLGDDTAREAARC